MTDPKLRLLVTDLDNTLWDWFRAWHESFSALLDGLVEVGGVDRGELESQIRQVHQHRGTTEYSNLVREIPCLIEAARGADPFRFFDSALHAQSSRRRSATSLYPGVVECLTALKQHGVRVIAYTESGAFWTEWRIRHTGLDGLIDVLYSSPDHDLDAGVEVDQLRTGLYPASSYGLRKTRHRHVPHGVHKPNATLLRSILEGEGCAISEAAYLGDSLMKDVAMAQEASVLDLHARYGVAQHLGEYDFLRRVSHWTDEEVDRERELASWSPEITPSVVCDQFADVMSVFALD